VDKEILLKYIDQHKSIRDTAKELGCSYTTIRYWLNKYELKTSPFSYKCSKCGTETLNAFSKGRFTNCKKCRAAYESGRGIKRKRQVVEFLGGKCVKCGYNKNTAALDIHHTNPQLKAPNWVYLRNNSFNIVKKELEHCVLMCKNCHAEIHYPKCAIENK
jgi:hypothetical protein